MSIFVIGTSEEWKYKILVLLKRYITVIVSIKYIRNIAQLYVVQMRDLKCFASSCVCVWSPNSLAAVASSCRLLSIAILYICYVFNFADGFRRFPFAEFWYIFSLSFFCLSSFPLYSGYLLTFIKKIFFHNYSVIVPSMVASRNLALTYFTSADVAGPRVHRPTRSKRNLGVSGSRRLCLLLVNCVRCKTTPVVG